MAEIEIKGMGLWVHPCGITLWSKEPPEAERRCLMGCRDEPWIRAHTPPPPEDSLQQILTEVKEHHYAFIEHGLNCSCMAMFIRRIRLLVRVVNPDHHRVDGGKREDRDQDLDWRIDHVMQVASQWR